MIHFYKTPQLFRKLSKDLIWQKPDDEKSIYLTFDDGPIPGLTEKILAILKSFHAKATFFCVGDNINKHQLEFERLLEDGHRIGNHTYNHVKGWNTPAKDYISNIEECQQLIDQRCGIESVPLFRPPYGQITRRQIGLLKHNFEIVMWTLLAYDFSYQHSPEQSLQKLINYTSEGSIVVFHDNYKAERKLMHMLPRFLDHCTKQGYSFKILPSKKI